MTMSEPETPTKDPAPDPDPAEQGRVGDADQPRREEEDRKERPPAA
jgi:hypothetical protein